MRHLLINRWHGQRYSDARAVCTRMYNMLRKDPPKTAGLTLLATLAISALVLYAAYLKSPPAASPKTLSLYSPRPTTRPTTRAASDTVDSLIIQANSAQLE